jgi:hypothetical protein
LSVSAFRSVESIQSILTAKNAKEDAKGRQVVAPCDYKEKLCGLCENLCDLFG